MTEVFTIERLGHHGDGLAADGLAAPLTLPGEQVSGCVVDGRLTDIRILAPSSSRVSPPCRHFKTCGGCQVQHASDALVEAWKRDVVTRALAANEIQTEMRPVFTSEPRSRRRAVFSARRTKKAALAGFHTRASDVIVNVPECQLVHPALLAALPLAQDLARIGASRRGELSLTVTLSDAGLDVAVEGGAEADGPLLTGLAQAANEHDLARLAWNGEIIAMQRPPVQAFGPARVVPPFGAFLQATKSGEAALLRAVQEIVGQASHIADLFAGCGTFALPLAQQAEIHAVEGDAGMIDALDQGWRAAKGLRLVTAEARDLFRRPLVPEELRRFDACVIDPPRAGAQAQIAELAGSGLGKIAYVSCNPVSFARDARLLVNGGYHLDWVQVVDQFRWSAHVELVGSFTLTST